MKLLVIGFLRGGVATGEPWGFRLGRLGNLREHWRRLGESPSPPKQNPIILGLKETLNVLGVDFFFDGSILWNPDILTKRCRLKFGERLQIAPYYCWWLKSYTTWDVWNPIYNGINGINYLSTGAGFQPSTVWRGFLVPPALNPSLPSIS